MTQAAAVAICTALCIAVEVVLADPWAFEPVPHPRFAVENTKNMHGNLPGRAL